MGASAARADALQRRLSTRGLSLSSVREHASGEALQRDLASARADALQRSPPEVLRALSLMEESVAEESAAEEAEAAEQVEEEAEEAATGLSSLFSPLRGSQVSSLFSPLQSEAAVATTGQAEAEAAAGLTSLFSPLRGAKGGAALAATTTPRRRRAVAGQAEAEAELARLKAELAV